MDNILRRIIEEVALEGLDGITIPTLWLRLVQPEAEFNLKLTENVKSAILKVLSQEDEIEFFKLQHARAEPQVFNRFPSEPNIGNHMAVAPDEKGEFVDVYKISVVDDVLNSIRGSCKEYQTRKYVTAVVREMTDFCEEYFSVTFGLQNFVIVASQRLRINALLCGSHNVSPKELFNLTPIQYCILERLGRARCQGELQVLLDQEVFKDNKKHHIHYIMRTLTKLKLISRRSYSYNLLNSKASPQILIHHCRFLSSKFAQYDSMMQVAYRILDREPNKTLSLLELQDKLMLNVEDFKKLYKLMMKCKRDCTITHFDDHGKNTFVNKMVTYVGKSLNEFETDADIDDEDAPVTPQGDNSLVIEHPFTLQAWHYVLEHSSNGVTVKDLLTCFPGYGRLETRNLHRILERMNLTKTVLVANGKQRVQKYFPADLTELNDIAKEFFEAKKKMKYLVLTSFFQGSNTSELSATPSSSFGQTSTTVSVTTPSQLSLIEHLQTFETDQQISDMTVALNSSFMNTTSSSMETTIVDTPVSDSTKKINQTLTTRSISRRNIIISYVNSVRVVEGVSKIYWEIMNAEKAQGCLQMIDRKTVKRLVEKMHNEGLIKLVKVSLQVKEKPNMFWFVGSITATDQEIEDTINKTKFRVLTSVTQRSRPSNGREISVRDYSDENLYDIYKSIPHTTMIPNPYGVAPKFTKMIELHRFLLFLSYWNELDYKNASTDGVTKLEQQWRDNIPLLPACHDPALKGKISLSDILSVIPVNLFCKIQKIDQLSDEFMEYLTHEEKQFSILAKLPERLRAVITFKRKHIFSVFRIIEFLAFMGSLSIGCANQGTLPKKDLQYVTLHKNLAFLDTRGSEPGYAKTSIQEYEKRHFKIDSIQTLDMFWNELKAVSMGTQLGYRSLAEHEEKLPRLDSILKSYVDEHSKRQVDVLDDGTIPGDGRGACGLDSAFCVHYTKNWDYWNEKKNLKNSRNCIHIAEIDGENLDFPKKPRLRQIENKKKAKGKAKKDDDMDYEVVKVDNVGRNKKVSGGKGVKRKKTLINKLEKEERKSKRMKLKEEKERLVDEIDRIARKSRNGRIRAVFDSSEDALLILCFVASTILQKKYNLKQSEETNLPVPHYIVRNLLMKELPKFSFDKTAESCGRRLRFLLSNPKNQVTQHVCVLECLNDDKFFTDLEDIKIDTPENVEKSFTRVVKQLMAKYDEQPGLINLEIPDTCSSLHRLYNIASLQPRAATKALLSTRSESRVVSTMQDVKKFNLENIIFVSLLQKKYCYEATPRQMSRLFDGYGYTEMKESVAEMYRNSVLSIRSTNDIYNKRRAAMIPHLLPSHRLNRKFDRLLQSVLYHEHKDNIEKLTLLSDVFSIENEVCSLDKILAMFNISLLQSGHIEIIVPEQMLTAVDFGTSMVETDIEVTQNETAWFFSRAKSINKPKNSQSMMLKNIDKAKLTPCKVVVSSTTNSKTTVNFENFLQSLSPRKFQSSDDSDVFKNPEHTSIINAVIQALDTVAGPMGMSEFDLYNHILSEIHDVFYCTFVEVIAKLQRCHMIYKVGVMESVLVLSKHADDWFATGCEFYGRRNQNYSTPDVENNDELNPKLYKDVKFICRPWHTVDGKSNIPAIHMMATSVYFYIFNSPGATLSKIMNYYLPVFQKVVLMEILEVLCDAGCIERKTFVPTSPRHVFGRKTKIQDVVDCFFPVEGSEYKLSKIVQHLHKLTPDPHDVPTPHTSSYTVEIIG